MNTHISISVRMLASLLALTLVAGLLAVMAALHQSGSLSARPEPGTGCYLVHGKLGKRPVVQTNICWPNIPGGN